MAQPEMERITLLHGVKDLAREAGRVILRFYGDEIAVTTKADRTPVTEADHAAEAIILPGLKKLAPDIPVVAEEDATKRGLPAAAANRFWLVDPLDGTREFLKRNGEFTVNIALVEDGEPVLGVVHLPALDLTYAAAGPGTATIEEGGKPPRPIQARKTPAEGHTVLISRSHLDKESTESFLKTIHVARTVVAGSSLKFGRIAAGEGDLYVRLGRTMEWDTAAGQAVLVAAGGRVELLDGGTLRYGKKGFENPHFLARGRADG
jgi:3'(2'), 5'-bisphosphate nucleotidase